MLPFLGLPYMAGVFCLGHGGGSWSSHCLSPTGSPPAGEGKEGRNAALHLKKGVIGTFTHSTLSCWWSLATWPHLAGRRLDNVLFIFYLQFMKQSFKNSSKTKKLFQIYLTSVSLKLKFLKVSVRVIFELSVELAFFNYYLSHHSQPSQSSWPLLCLGFVCVDDKLLHEFLTLLSKSGVTGDQTVSWCEWSCAIITVKTGRRWPVYRSMGAVWLASGHLPLSAVRGRSRGSSWQLLLVELALKC